MNSKPALYINDDFGNLFFEFDFAKVMPQFDNSCSGGGMCLDENGLRQQIDYYSAAGVHGILFNVNGMRAMFDSHAFEPVWQGLEERPDGRCFYRGREVGITSGHNLKALCLNARELFRRVPDPYRVRYDYCRQKSLEMWLSMRMNDVHWADAPESIVHGNLWYEHPEWRRATFKTQHSFWFSQCLDYACPEVYQHHLSLVSECLERFEMDGFELDWMRSPFFFRPGFTQAGRCILTRFMRDSRKLAEQAGKRWGHPVKVAVRVPAWPEEALAAGLDVFAWSDEGLVDLVVPSPYFTSTDATLPVELWRRLLPAGVVLAPCLECQVSSGLCAPLPTSPEIDAGFAASYYEQGAEALYLFNHMLRFSGYQDLAAQRRMFSVLSNREQVEKHARRHIATVHECIVEGRQNTLPFPLSTPASCTASVLLSCGAGVAGRDAELILGFQGVAAESLQVWVNGGCCCIAGSRDLPALPKSDLNYVVFRIPDHLLHDGVNSIDIINGSSNEMFLKWLEITLQESSLKGKPV